MLIKAIKCHNACLSPGSRQRERCDYDSSRPISRMQPHDRRQPLLSRPLCCSRVAHSLTSLSWLCWIIWATGRSSSTLSSVSRAGSTCRYAEWSRMCVILYSVFLFFVTKPVSQGCQAHLKHFMQCSLSYQRHRAKHWLRLVPFWVWQLHMHTWSSPPKVEDCITLIHSSALLYCIGRAYTTNLARLIRDFICVFHLVLIALSTHVCACAIH